MNLLPTKNDFSPHDRPREERGDAPKGKEHEEMKKRIIAVVIACVLTAGVVGLIAAKKSAQQNELRALAQIKPVEEAALAEEPADSDAVSVELSAGADVPEMYTGNSPEMYTGDSLLADSEPEGPKPKLDAIDPDPDVIAEVPEELKKVYED